MAEEADSAADYCRALFTEISGEKSLIYPADLRTVVARLHLPDNPDLLDSLVKSMSPDGSGALTYEEFESALNRAVDPVLLRKRLSAAVANHKDLASQEGTGPVSREELLEAFSLYTKASDPPGKISLGTMREVLSAFLPFSMAPSDPARAAGWKPDPKAVKALADQVMSSLEPVDKNGFLSIEAFLNLVL
jgi:Ca2+-binding EF-hand superfamily protein